MKILDEGILRIKYATSFRNEFCIMGGYNGTQVIGPRNLERFKALTAPYIFRATKDELGIAAKQYSTWVFDLLPVERRAYDEMRRLLLAEIESGEITTATNAAVKCLRLQQISNGFIMDDETKAVTVIAEEGSRINALGEFLAAEESVSPIIIWCRFLADIAIVVAKLASMKISYSPVPRAGRDRATGEGDSGLARAGDDGARCHARVRRYGA